MHIHNHTINAHYDFEFNFKAPRKINYSISVPDGAVEGFVVFIAGFGDDAGTYRKSFQKHICNEYSMACLTVDYHCLHARPGNGGQPVIEPSTVKLLRSLTGYENNESLNDVVLKANSLKADPTIPLKIPATIIPGKNEYQNFGLLPALDNLYAMHDVFKRYSNIPKKIYSIGSSYGGYIANIMSKLAPCTINAVFDNSSWAVPNINYVVGHDIGIADVVQFFKSDIRLELNVLSPWSKYLFMPNSFGKSRLLIRSFPEEHLDVMKKVGECKTVYRFVHSEKDGIANPQEKISLAKQMMMKGFNVQMNVYSENDIDGAYIKNMNHGMGLSLRKFFSMCYENSKSDIHDDQRTDFDFEHSLQFICDDLTYSVNYTGKASPVCSVFVTEI